MDDTLFDHTGTCRRALRWLAGRTPALQGRPFAEVARRYGELLEEIQPDIFAGRIDHDAARDLRFQELLTYCGAAPSREEAHRLSTRYRARYQAVRRAVPGARNLLRALHPRAFIGIISNNHALEQEEKLGAVGLDPWVDLLLTSEEARIAKPDPTIFALALERAQVAAPNAVMVGDNWRNDVEGAVSAGIRAVWFDRWGQPAPPRPPRVAVVRTLAPAGPLVDLLLDATPPRRAPAA